MWYGWLTKKQFPMAEQKTCFKINNYSLHTSLNNEKKKANTAYSSVTGPEMTYV